MPATSNYVLSKARKAATAVTKKRFVYQLADGSDSVGAITTAGNASYGVALFSVSASEITKGKLVSVQVEGRAVVEAGAALTEGTAVMSDNQGRAVPATTGLFVLGVVDEPAAATGNECSVVLAIPSRAKV